MPVSLIVIVSIAALLVFLLFPRIRLYAEYVDVDVDVDEDDKLNLILKYLLFSYCIKPRKAGKAKQKKIERAKYSIDQIHSFIDLFERFWKEMNKYLVKFKNKIRVDHIKICLTIGDKNPALTAMYYGGACAVVFPTVGALSELVNIKKREVSVTPNFNGDGSIEFKSIISIRLGSALAIIFAAAVKMFISLIKNPIDISRLRKRGVAK